MYRLIAMRSNYRLYQFDHLLTQGINGAIPRPTDFVVVSDAMTHPERLVFPAYFDEYYTLDKYLSGEQTIRVDFDEIEGTGTHLFDLCAAGTIEPDENYLDRLEGYNAKPE